MLFLRKTDEAIWKLPFLKESHFQLTPLFLSNFFMTPLFVQIPKTRYPSPPNFRGGGGGNYAEEIAAPKK